MSPSKQYFGLLRALALAGTALLPGACGDCAGVGRPAFEVTVLENSTGVPAASGATLFVFKRPDYRLVDSAMAQDSLRIDAAWDEEGRFDLLLERPDYWPWTVNNVAVTTESNCSIKTVFLIARLRRRDG